MIAADGSMLGVLDTQEAQRMAREQALDLVEVNPKAFPPVCKIMDFGKFKYEQTKKARKQKQHQQQLKEIRFRPQVGDHDLEVKLKHAREILAEKDKVLLVVQFKGREMAHTEMGVDKLKSVVELLNDCAKVEQHPRREGRRVIAVLAPK